MIRPGPATLLAVLVSLTTVPRDASGASALGPLLAPLRVAPEGPSITVRGSSRLEVNKIERVQGGVMLTVRLVDGELGDGIPDKEVTVTIQREGVTIFRASRATSKEGSAQIFVPHRRGEYELSLRFPGDALYVPATPTTSRVDLSKEAIQLSLTVPPRVDVGARSVPVSVAARHQHPIADLPVEVVARRAGRVMLRRKGRTDTEGQLRLQLAPRDLGGAGELLLEAHSSATPQYNAARAVQRIFLVSETTTTLRFERHRGRRDARLQAHGMVRDATGPVAGAAVRLLGAGRVLITLSTDDKGRFATRLPLRQLPTGKVAVEALFVPRTAWRKPSRSAPVVISVEPPKPIPMAYFLVPALVTLLFLVGVVVIRRKPWRALHARWQARQAPRRPEVGGIELGRRRSMSGLFGVDLLSVNGTVLDLQEGRPLAGAVIYLRGDDADRPDRQTHAEPDGTFSLPEVSAGSWELLVTYPGYLPQSLRLVLPHRGELHGLLVRLQSVRHRVMSIYAGVVAPRLPDPALIRYWTPAEASAHLRTEARPASEGIEALTDLASEVYYGPEIPGPEEVRAVESLAEQARPPTPPVGPGEPRE